MFTPKKESCYRGSICLHLPRKVISQLKPAKFSKSKIKYAIFGTLTFSNNKRDTHLFPLTIHKSELRPPSVLATLIIRTLHSGSPEGRGHSVPGSGQGMWLQFLPFYPPHVWSGTDCLLENRVNIDYLRSKVA